MAATIYRDFNTPPTFNTLDSRQKTRLIRTTRKLGAVLGTTPHLAESATPISLSPHSGDSPNTDKPLPFSPKRDRKRRQGSIFEFPPPSAPFAYDYASSSASSSVSSLALPRSSIDSNTSEESTQSLPTPKSFARHVHDKSRSKGKRAPLPAPLVLRLNAVALPPSDPRIATPDTAATLKSSGLGVGASAGTRSAIPVTPTTPGSPSTPTITETRRKRLAKLKRTLGENVPVELIMPLRAARPQRPSPIEVPSTAQTVPQSRLMGAPHQHTTLHSRQDQTTRTKPLPRPQNTVPPARPSPSANSNSNSNPTRGGARKRSASVDFKHGVMSPALSAPAAPHPPPKPHPYHHSRAPSHAANLISPSHPAVSYSVTTTLPREPARSPGLGSDSDSSSSARVWVTGAASWTGEWNRKDIREVQQRLRTLKLR